MAGGNDADAEIELLITDSQLNAAVLGTPPLGDVHFGKDFYAGNDGAKKAARRAIALVQNPIDPIANPDDFLERLDVNVGRAKLDRLLDHQLNKPDDGGAVLIDDVTGPH